MSPANSSTEQSVLSCSALPPGTGYATWHLADGQYACRAHGVSPEGIPHVEAHQLLQSLRGWVFDVGGYR